ncbi:MAG: hypothetical protein Kow0059_02890 [Candidatus Sumerlaeia bacterium]
MSLARKGFFDYFTQNAALVLTFVAGLLFDRYFGRAGRGEYHLILVAYALLPNLVNMGLEISVRVHTGRSPDQIAAIHSAGLVMIALITVLTGGMLMVFGEPIRAAFFEGVTPEFLLLAVGLLPFVLYHLLWQGIFIGLGDLYVYARVNMWNRIAQGAAVILLITFFQPTIRWMVYAIVPIQFVTFGVTVGLMRRRCRLWTPIQFDLLRRLLTFGWLVYVGNFAVNLLQRVDVLIAKHFYTLSDVGLYGRATMFSDKLTNVAGSFERMLYAPLARAGEEEAVFLVQKAFRHNLYLNLLGAAALYGLALMTLSLLLPDFLDSLQPLRFLLLAVIFKSFSSIFAAWFTAYRKQPHVPGLINWITLPFHFVVCWNMTKHFGIVGASAATALTFGFHAALFGTGFALTSHGARLRAMLLPTREDLRYYFGFIRK